MKSTPTLTSTFHPLLILGLLLFLVPPPAAESAGVSGPARKPEREKFEIPIHYPPGFEDLVWLKKIQRVDDPLLLDRALQQFAIHNRDLGSLLLTGDLQLIVGGGVQAPPEQEQGEFLLLEALGMAPDHPGVLAAVMEWHLWELGKPPINQDVLNFHRELLDRWERIEPDNGAPTMLKAYLMWQFGNRTMVEQLCRQILEKKRFDNHCRFQQEAVVRACERVQYGPSAARDRAMGIGAASYLAFRGMSSQILRNTPPAEAPELALLLDQVAQHLQPFPRTLLQEEALLATRATCLRYLARIPSHREMALKGQGEITARRNLLKDLLDHHRSRDVERWSESDWVAFFNQAIAEGEESALRSARGRENGE